MMVDMASPTKRHRVGLIENRAALVYRLDMVALETPAAPSALLASVGIALENMDAECPPPLAVDAAAASPASHIAPR